MTIETNTATRYSNIGAELSRIRDSAIARRGARDQIVRLRNEEEAMQIALTVESQSNQKAQVFLQSMIVEMRETAIRNIEEMGTSALRMVYGDDFRLIFDTAEEKRREGASNFSMRIMVEMMSKGKLRRTGLIGHVGGGLVETVAYTLRIANLNWMEYTGPLLMDEAFKSMSNDRKIGAIARLLRRITDVTGRQLIFATHNAPVFGEYADNICRVSVNDGVGSITKIDPANAKYEAYDEPMQDDFEDMDDDSTESLLSTQGFDQGAEHYVEPDDATW